MTKEMVMDDVRAAVAAHKAVCDLGNEVYYYPPECKAKFTVCEGFMTFAIEIHVAEDGKITETTNKGDEDEYIVVVDNLDAYKAYLDDLYNND